MMKPWMSRKELEEMLKAAQSEHDGLICYEGNNVDTYHSICSLSEFCSLLCGGEATDEDKEDKEDKEEDTFSSKSSSSQTFSKG